MLSPEDLIKVSNLYDRRKECIKSRDCINKQLNALLKKPKKYPLAAKLITQRSIIEDILEATNMAISKSEQVSFPWGG